MYNRFSDISKFILHSDRLKVVNNYEVYISNEEDHDIYVDIEDYNFKPTEDEKLSQSKLDKYSNNLNIVPQAFDLLKPLIIDVARSICKLDNLVQEYNKEMDNSYDYSIYGDDDFHYELPYVLLKKPSLVILNYVGCRINTEFHVIFEYEHNAFYFKSFGLNKTLLEKWQNFEIRVDR